ncbi:MAG: protease modulator HflC [Deltaproteobacteria bacterium]|nr:protease modulator HflC [Deltaproteobacteria bacterium]
MKGWKIIIAVVIVGLIALSGTLFIVPEGQQAIVTQFGRPLGEPKFEAGLYVKAPFIHKVHRFEKRLLKWDGSPNQIPTRDKKYIWVDTTARYLITNPLRYLQTVANERGALSRLDDIIDSVVRDYVSSNLLVELVRSEGWQLKPQAELEVVIPFEDVEGVTQPLRAGRLAITREMLAAAQELTPRYGIALVDIRIKRINYVEQVRMRVFERMISERQRIAAQLRSEGEGRRAEVLGQMEKELARIRSGAYRKALEIKGRADAEATKIYGSAYNQDPEFYAMTRTLETYEDYPNEDSTLILTTDSDFFQYLKGAGAGALP